MKPIDIVLYCPKCGMQHIDAPENRPMYADAPPVWTNPPHKTHLCHGCGHLWRPSDHPTNGVARTESGKNADTSPRGWRILEEGPFFPDPDIGEWKS